MHKLFPGSAYLLCLLTLTACGGGGGGGGPAPVKTYTISGNASGLSSALTLSLSGGSVDELTVAQDGSFTFSKAVNDGADYLVTVKHSSTDYCAITNPGGTVAGANITNIAVACEPGYQVGGTITGLNGSIELNVNGNVNTISNGSSFTSSLLVADATPYTVTIQTQPVGQTCVVSNGGSGTIAGAGVNDVTIDCVNNPYYISGTISGIPGGVSASISNGTETISVFQDGSFSFPTALITGDSYSISYSFSAGAPQNLACTVSNGTGTMVASDITNVSLQCGLKYSVGGKVSGLFGNLVLQNNLGDNLSVNASGNFNFATLVDENGIYAVSVLSQPSDQQCTVVNGSGTVTSNITTIAVNCADVITPLVIKDETGKYPQLTLAVAVSKSDVPGNRLVTVTVSGAAGLPSTELYNLCIDGLAVRVRFPTDIKLPPATTNTPGYCLNSAVLVNGDYVLSMTVPYGTYSVSMVAKYTFMLRQQIRTLANVYKTVKVRGPVVQNSYSASVPVLYNAIFPDTRDNTAYLSDTEYMVASSTGSGVHGQHVDRVTNQVKNFSYTGYFYPKAYKKRVYAVFEGGYGPGDGGVGSVWINRYDLATDSLTVLSFRTITQCKGLEPAKHSNYGGDTLIMGHELRGLYECGYYDSSNNYWHYLVAWRYNLDTETLVSQQLLDSYKSLYSTDGYTAAGVNGYTAEGAAIRLISRRYVTTNPVYLGAFNLYQMSWDSCYDPANNYYMETRDPDTGATRCLIKNPASGSYCVESNTVAGTCDTTINGHDYMVRTGTGPGYGFVLSDGSLFTSGSVLTLDTPLLDYDVGVNARYDGSYSTVVGGIGYDPLAYYRTTYSDISKYLSQVGGSLSNGNKEALSTYVDENGKTFAALSQVKEDALIPGVIPTGEVDDFNKRYFMISDPDYKVKSVCTEETLLNVKDCVTVQDSQRFQLHQRISGDQSSRGGYVEIEGPVTDQGIRVIPAANTPFGNKPITVLGSWIRKIGNEIVSRFIFEIGATPETGSGTARYWSYDYGYQVDGVYVEYDWRLNGASIEFRYKNILNCDFLNTHKWEQGTYDPYQWVQAPASVTSSNLTLNGLTLNKESPANGNGKPTLGGACTGA